MTSDQLSYFYCVDLNICDNSKNIYFQCNLVHSWGGTTNYTGDQLKLRVTFEYSTDNSTWATVPNSGENSQVYYERSTSKVIYFVTSAYDLAVDIRYTMSGSSLSDNTAYYFRAKMKDQNYFVFLLYS